MLRWEVIIIFSISEPNLFEYSYVIDSDVMKFFFQSTYINRKQLKYYQNTTVML